MANFNESKEIRKILNGIPEDIFNNDKVIYKGKILRKYHSGYCLMVGFKCDGLPPMLCVEAYPNKTFAAHTVSFANRLPKDIKVPNIQDIVNKCTAYLKLIGLTEKDKDGMFLRWITIDGH